MSAKEPNTAATGMGEWRFTRSDLLGSVVVTYPNGHEVTFRTRDIGAVIVAKVIEDMANALAAQPAPGMGDAEIIEIRDRFLPSQGEPFDTLAFGRAVAHAAQPAPVAVDEQPRPMATAPKDGTIVRLLVRFTENGFEDAGPEKAVWTIGQNGADHHPEDDEWLFAGWNWEQDCFTQGIGEPIGWLPMLATPAQPAPVVGGFDAWWKSFSVSAESPDTLDDRTFAEAAWSAALLSARPAGSVAQGGEVPDDFVLMPLALTDSMTKEAIYNTNRKYDKNPVDALIVEQVYSSLVWARPVVCAQTPATGSGGELLSARPGKSTEGDEKVAVDFYTNNPGAALADLRERLSARPGGEGEAVAEVGNDESIMWLGKAPKAGTKLYTHPTPAGGEGEAGVLCGMTPGQSKVEFLLRAGAIPEWLDFGTEVTISAHPAQAGGVS